MAEPVLSYACSHDLKAESRGNELYGTPGLVHLCSGQAAVTDPEHPGRWVLRPCECACGHQVLPTSAHAAKREQLCSACGSPMAEAGIGWRCRSVGCSRCGLTVLRVRGTEEPLG